MSTLRVVHPGLLDLLMPLVLRSYTVHEQRSSVWLVWILCGIQPYAYKRITERVVVAKPVYYERP